MPAITVGFAEFEARLERIRRRLNLGVLVEAACIAGCSLLLAVAISIAAEATASMAVAAWVRRGAIGSAVAIAAVAAFRLRRHWFDLAKTARHVDRSADLNDRVATMLAHPSAQIRSPMRAILLWQIFDRVSDWEIERVAPWRLTRPAAALAAALAILSAAVFFFPAEPTMPDPATALSPQASNPGSAAMLAGGESPVLSGQRAGASGERDANAGTDMSQRGEGGDRGDAGHPAGADEPRHDEAGSGAAGAESSVSGTDNPAGEGDRQQGADPAVDAAGASPPGLPDSLAPEDLKPREPPTAPGELPRLPKAADPGATAAENAAKKTDAENPASADPQRPAQEAGGAKATSRNPQKAGVAGTRGLLEGGKDDESPDGDKVEPMVIQLKAFAASPPEHYEPQGEADKRADAATTSNAPTGHTTELAEAQAGDSLLQRSVVTRAHQELIRELFTPERQ